MNKLITLLLLLTTDQIFHCRVLSIDGQQKSMYAYTVVTNKGDTAKVWSTVKYSENDTFTIQFKK